MKRNGLVSKESQTRSLTQEEADATVNEAVSRVLRAYGRGGYLTLVEIDEDGFAVEELGRTEPIKPGTNNDTLASLYKVIGGTKVYTPYSPISKVKVK